MLATIQQRARGLQVLVDNLMHHSSTGQLKLSCEPLQVANLLADVRLTVEPLLARKEQSLQVIGTADDVVGDRARLVQVLVNLILNASKFSATGASIELEFNVRGSTVWCQVADRGIGLPPGPTAWLFEPAARADHSSMGLGLGLAIVKSIIEAHGGRVGAANRRGGGAQFWFTLPRAAEG